MPATDKFVHDLKKVHVVFAVSAFALLAVTIWMMAADHNDPWRPIQKKGFNLDAERTSREIDLAKDDEFLTKQQQLEQQRAAADDSLEAIQTQVDDLTAQFDEADRLFGVAEAHEKERREYLGVARANYDIGVRDNLPATELERLKQKFNAEQDQVDVLALQTERRQTDRNEALQALGDLTKERDGFVAQLTELQSETAALEKSRQQIAPTGLSGIKRTLMEWPIIDGFNSHLRIHQDWLPDLEQVLGMTSTARFDRCRTCHMNVDKIESGNLPAYPFGHPSSESIDDWIDENKYPHPYATHPRPDLYLTASSPHPVGTFGCTICHEGQGSGTDFTNAAHYFNDPHEYHEWQDEHGFKTNHFWEYPMYPKRFQEASCIKCHHRVIELATNPEFGESAPKVVEGYDLIKRYGCFGCHEINGYKNGDPIGPDIRLEPQTEEQKQKVDSDPSLFAGEMRKVGPSFRHVGDKTSDAWLQFWTEEPMRFRPTTRMPQFFGLSDQFKAHGGDETAETFEPVEIAGIAHYLLDKSEPLDLVHPDENYEPNAERGKELFATRGCLGCHSHKDFPDITEDFGPELSRVYAKLLPGKAGFDWLYTWVKDPMRHHPRTKMPNLFLEPYTLGEVHIDPAADIAAYLTTKDEQDTSLEFSHATKNTVDESALLDLTRLHLPLSADDKNAVLADGGQFPLDASGTVKGDEVELVFRGSAVAGGDQTTFKADFDATAVGLGPNSELAWTSGKNRGRKYKVASFNSGAGSLTLADALNEPPAAGDTFVVNGPITHDMLLNYVGRRSISRFGCYGCHDIPGFKEARPIGTTLQAWGRKETSKLAPEHIEHWLHHHGEPDGSSTHDRAQEAVRRAEADEFATEEDEQNELSAAYFYESLSHHGRAGFLWQKLRQPRSYDYEKADTKRYDERLRMPKFPLDEQQIEAIATFVLGLVAEPPSSEYLYKPEGPAHDRVEGELLINKYNCAACHILDLPEVEYGVGPDELVSTPITPADHPAAIEKLLELNPPRSGKTGKTIEVGEGDDKQTLSVINFHGLLFQRPDAELDLEDREHYFDLWETLDVDDVRLLPGSRMIVPEASLVSEKPARGGKFAEWLVERLMKTTTQGTRALAWQKSPPPLYREGVKVQTPWLYEFLLDPGRIRHETVLRMPKFNMSPDEAKTLANYFAAVDGAGYPYQHIDQREPQYIEMKNRELEDVLAGGNEKYLTQSWKTLNAPLCIKCHSLAGRTVKVADPKKDVRGPDLDGISRRIRPDWLLVWLFKPQWVTPYTSMPANFPAGQDQFPDLLGGNASDQIVGVRDALMNYYRLIETEGVTIYEPPTPTAAPPAGEE